ncbi:MAG: Sir2 family NAD-dependent protein deacetylase [Acidimicrobiia bacterium]|nr:Sir2 family NAD-dependent protein deacetylase [Acidimicrobiia bacterium]
MDPDVGALGQLIDRAHAILILTGAGISTASGIPDFRGPNGIWKTERPVHFDQFLASEKHRRAYWDQKVRAATVFQDAKPNRVHDACVELEQVGKVEVIVTQNIDGLHSDAGTSTDRLVEIHGTAREAACLSCDIRTPIEVHIDSYLRTDNVPICNECGGLVKPATISFGQSLDPVSLDRAQQSAERCDLVVALGSTLGVYPAARIPYAPTSRGVPYAIVNKGETEHDGWPTLTLRIDGDVTLVFPEAVQAALAG